MSLKHKTVLVVDDDEDILLLLKKILAPSGLKVFTANSPEEGRKLLIHAPHIILSDLHMEPEDGFSFIQSTNSQKQYQNIPILVLSSLNDFNSVKKAISLGVRDYVLKPVQAPMLLRKIRKALMNQDFLRWDIPESEEISMTVPIQGSVIAIGETGYYLSGGFKLSPAQEVKVSCEIFSELRLENLPQKTSQLMKTYQSDGKFINDVTFVGIGEKESSAIRQFLIKRRN